MTPATTSQVNSLTTFNFFDKQQFDAILEMAEFYAQSDLVPDIYKVSEKVSLLKAKANCMIAIEIAMRANASVLMIMQNMAIIYGRPAWSSKYLIATVNSCGRFNPLQYKFTEKGVLGMVEYTDYIKTWVKGVDGGKGYYKNEPKIMQFDGTKIIDVECVAYTTSKGSDNILESSAVSIRMAVQEGWYTKNGSKWPTMTKQMLMYRAASFWTNAYAPELSMGMKTEEEIRDIIEADYIDLSKQNQKNVNINFEDNSAAPIKETDVHAGTNNPEAATSAVENNNGTDEAEKLHSDPEANNDSVELPAWAK